MTVHIILGEFDGDTTTVLEVQEDVEDVEDIAKLVKHFQSQGCYSNVWSEKWEVWGGKDVNLISPNC